MSMKNLSLVCMPFNLYEVDPSAQVTLPRVLTAGLFSPAHLQPTPASTHSRVPHDSPHRRANTGVPATRAALRFA